MILGRKLKNRGNLDDMKAKLEALNEKLKLLQLNYMNKLQAQQAQAEQKQHKQQIIQATTS